MTGEVLIGQLTLAVVVFLVLAFTVSFAWFVAAAAALFLACVWRFG